MILIIQTIIIIKFLIISKFFFLPAEPQVIDICELSMEQGPCRAGFHRFYYDTNEAECKEFTYGGCGGNENRFNNIEDCKSRCVKTTTTPKE